MKPTNPVPTVKPARRKGAKPQPPTLQQAAPFTAVTIAILMRSVAHLAARPPQEVFEQFLAYYGAKGGLWAKRWPQFCEWTKPVNSAPASPAAAPITTGDWVAYTDSYGRPQVGQVDSIWKVGRLIPGQQASTPRTEYTLSDADGKAALSPDYTKPITRTSPPEAAPFNGVIIPANFTPAPSPIGDCQSPIANWKRPAWLARKAATTH